MEGESREMSAAADEKNRDVGDTGRRDTAAVRSVACELRTVADELWCSRSPRRRYRQLQQLRRPEMIVFRHLPSPVRRSI